MTTTSEPVAVLRQPVESINDPEQALRVIGIEPDPSDLTTAYAMGYLNGALAGKRLCFNVMTSADHRAHDDAYATHLRPRRCRSSECRDEANI